MRERRDRLFHSFKTDSQFLFYRTEEAAPTSPEKSGAATETLLNSLNKAFPDMTCGREFVRQAMAAAETARVFCALVVKIDGDAGGVNENDMVRAARAIHVLCREKRGIWGGVDDFLFACGFPEKTSEEGRAIAEELQKVMVHRAGRTATIGIAQHPHGSFDRRRLYENAEKALAHAAFFGPNSAVVFDAVSLNISGDQLYQSGDLAGAMAEFEAALALDPENVNVHNSMGVCLGQTGDLERALSHFDTARSLDPEDPMVWYNAGLVHKLKKEDDTALEFFLKAGEIDGELFEAAFQAGKIYFEKGLTEMGEKYYRKAVSLKPENGQNYRFLGECYAALGRADDAVAAYKKAVIEHPNDAAALSALGCLFDEKGENPDIAMLFCRQSVDIAPENGLFHRRLGDLYVKRNELEKALVAFKKACDLGCDAAAERQRIQALVDNQDVWN